MSLGIQLTPWSNSRQLLAVGESLRDVVDVVWVQDQMLARNVYVLLAGLAQAGCGIGSERLVALTDFHRSMPAGRRDLGCFSPPGGCPLTSLCDSGRIAGAMRGVSSQPSHRPWQEPVEA